MKLSSHKAMVILFAFASILTTLLITLAVINKNHVLRGGVITSSNGQPPVLFPIDDFQLIQSSSKPFSSEQLHHKIWITNFVFTRCAGPCPVIISRMAELQQWLTEQSWSSQVKLVSLTVDPEYDTPAILAKRAAMVQAKQSSWFWLTGSREKIWALIRKGFKLPVDTKRDDLTIPIFHSQKFVLVDQNMRIRGYYDAVTTEDYKKLQTAIKQLVLTK